MMLDGIRMLLCLAAVAVPLWQRCCAIAEGRKVASINVGMRMKMGVLVCVSVCFVCANVSSKLSLGHINIMYGPSVRDAETKSDLIQRYEMRTEIYEKIMFTHVHTAHYVRAFRGLFLSLSLGLREAVWRVECDAHEIFSLLIRQ